jgi:hypothetical protein
MQRLDFTLVTVLNYSIFQVQKQEKTLRKNITLVAIVTFAAKLFPPALIMRKISLIPKMPKELQRSIFFLEMNT